MNFLTQATLPLINMLKILEGRHKMDNKKIYYNKNYHWF